MKKQLPGWAVLLIITLAAGLALGATYALTEKPIAEQALLSADNARKAALPDADSFEELTLSEDASVDWAYAGLKEGNTVGYVAQKTVNGFGGKVEVIAGVDTTGAPETFTIGGISVGGSSFSETAGLGARSKEPAFTDQFAGKVYPVSYIKAGGTATESTVDALTSATITTTAVVNGVNDIVKYIKADVMGIAGVEMPAKPSDGVFSASEKGFRGPVYVEAAFDGAGKVTYIKVGDESFAEDIGVGVIEPDFMIQFIGKQMPLEVSDIDVIAGATISSTAVVKALNNAYAIAGGAEIVAPETPTMPEKPADGVFSAAEQGFAGPVYVEAAFDEEGKITYLGVGDENFAETDGFGARALEPEEQYPFIGAQMPLEIGDVDALTGATFTKTAIVNGLNKAYAASKGEVIEEPVAEEIVMPERPADGVYSAAEQGFAGPVYVEAAFDANGKITYISVGDDQFAETDGFGAKALLPENQYPFIGAQMPLELGDVDALTGATFTKTAIVNGLNKAYAASKGETKAKPSATEAPAETKASADGTVTASAQGFGGPVAVTAAFDAEGKITSISIGDDAFNETTGLGARALEDAFQAQFIGKQMPLALSDIDAIAGATVTSTAVVDALNAAYEKSLNGGEQEEEDASASAVETKSEAPAFKEIRSTVNIATQKSDIQVKVSFVQNTVAGLVVMAHPAGSEQDYTLSELDTEMKNLFLAATLPLDIADQETAEAALVANAINAAYYAQGGQVKAKTSPAESSAVIIGGADGPTAIILSDPDSDGWYNSEVLCFFTEIQVEAQFENGKVSALNVSDKQAGIDTVYEPSSQEEAMRALFVGETLPLDSKQMTPYASAVAIALNQAFGQTGQTTAESGVPAADPDSHLSYGSCVMFFSQYNVLASFEGSKLNAAIIYTSPAGVPIEKLEDQDVSMLNDQALNDALIGREMPLDPAEFTAGIGDVPAYAVNAIVIALNDAYNQSSAGQQ